MKKVTTVLAASALAVVGAQANAALDFSSTTLIDGPALTLTGGGAGTGSGTFGAASLTINSVVTTQTNLVAPATITSSTLYNGAIAGGVFTADGTGSSVVACTGDAQVCDSVVGGAFTGGDVFSVATTGGSWTSTATQYNGLILTTTVSTLSAAVPVPAAAWLFGSALIGLAGVGRKRKMA